MTALQSMIPLVWETAVMASPRSSTIGIDVTNETAQDILLLVDALHLKTQDPNSAVKIKGITIDAFVATRLPAAASAAGANVQMIGNGLIYNGISFVSNLHMSGMEFVFVAKK